MVQPVWKHLKKLNTELPYNPAIPLPGIHSKELKAGTQTDFCRGIYVCRALFTIAKGKKQHKCPPEVTWINKMWCIEAAEHYSNLKGEATLIHGSTLETLC